MRIRHCLPLLLSGVMVLAGCANSPNAEEFQVAREMIVGGDGRALERADAETIYNTARGFIASGDALRALELYEELQTRYPFSDFATQAQLESVYANYLLDQWEAALAAADRFIRQHPRHQEIAYVYYLRGLINFERRASGGLFGVPGNQRDPSNLFRAFTDFNLLIQKFPDSVYNKDAQLRMIQIRHRLAAHELAVAEYYLTRQAWVAASRRAQYIVEHYQGTDSVPRALEVLEHAYRMLGLEDLAENARAVLVASYPNYLLHRTEFYRQRAGLDPRYELPPMDAAPQQPAPNRQQASAKQVSHR